MYFTVAPLSSRRIHRAASIAAAALSFAAFAALPAHAQDPGLVTNPDFETGDFTGWTTTPAASGSRFQVNALPHSGQYAALFGANGGLDDSISQMLPTIPGVFYSISFWLENDGSQTDNEFQASFGSDTLRELQGEPIFTYQQFSYIERATGPTTSLTFAGRQNQGYFALDDISVNEIVPEAVPEASTTVSLGLLLALGLGGVMIAAKRKKQSA